MAITTFINHGEDEFHFVWCVKRNKPILIGNIKDRLYQIINDTIDNLSLVDIKGLIIYDNYVWLRCEIHPQYHAHKLVKLLKLKTASILNKEFKHITSKLPSLWTNSYFTRVGDQLPTLEIDEYVANEYIR